MLFPGVVSMPLLVELTQDTTPELPELITVTLTAGDDVSLVMSTAQITILDTDSEDMYFIVSVHGIIIILVYV